MLQELKKAPKIERSQNEKQLFKNPVNRKTKRQKSKKGKVIDLTIDEQISSFAKIICDQLLKEMKFYE